MVYQCQIVEKMCNTKIESKISIVKSTEGKFKIKIISDCEEAKKFSNIIGELEWEKRDLYKLAPKDIWEIGKITGIRPFCPILPSIINCIWIELGLISGSLAKKSILRIFFIKNKNKIGLVFNSPLCGHSSTFKKQGSMDVVLRSSCEKAKILTEKILNTKLDLIEDVHTFTGDLTPTCYLPSLLLYILLDKEKSFKESSEREKEIKLICEISFLEV